MNAVEEILALVTTFRQFNVPVEFEPGWETRGNGSTAAYEGGILHHTAIAASYANPGPGTRVLRDGRPDLDGPLCNFQNKFNGVVRVIAAHPANHAGAGAGRWMGPLPRTRLFNPRVVGMENDYAGNTPMSPEQYRTSKVYAVAIKRRYGSIERCRLHAETSEEGKWDAGYKPGTPIDAAAFRRDALALEGQEEDDMFTEADRELLRQLQAGVEGQRAAGDVYAMLAEVRDALRFGKTGERDAGEFTGWLAERLDTIESRVSTGGTDVNELAEALVATGKLGGATKGEVASIIHSALSNTTLVHKDSTWEGGQ